MSPLLWIMNLMDKILYLGKYMYLYMYWIILSPSCEEQEPSRTFKIKILVSTRNRTGDHLLSNPAHKIIQPR